MAHILVVDDDADLRQLLLTALERDGHQVTALDRGSAVTEAHCRWAHCILLDVMMPGEDGFATCQRLRDLTKAPILFLTAKSAEKDMLSAYGSGGDDFLSKPFSHGELLAKVNSLLRRYREYRGKDESGLSIGDLDVDFASHSVKCMGNPVPLTDTEYAILEHLLKNRGKTVTAAELYEAVWGEKFLSGSGNTVMVHVLNLRRKVEAEPSSPKLIRTVWGKGYQID